jgi:hypothetical protein
MLIRIKPGFEVPMKIADKLNPILVILSIIGLFFEYTSLKVWVLLPNQIISLIFVADFLLRLVSMPMGKYFFHGFGWVDFLASLPGFFLVLGNTPLLSVFKIVRVGRFFKILRILRFLRVFSFLKQMKADSPWVQERIMQIGVSIVLVFVLGIISIDTSARTALEQPVREKMMLQYELSGKNVEILGKSIPGIALWTKEGLVYNSDGVKLELSKWFDFYNSEKALYIEIALEEGIVSPDKLNSIPVAGVLYRADDLQNKHNTFMLILLTTLVALLVVIIFYMGFLFAKDMLVVQLVVDSIDADDYYLLSEEADKHRDENGDFILEEGESEMVSLLKMSGKLASQKEFHAGASSLYSSTESDSSTDESLTDSNIREELELLRSRITDLEDTLPRQSRRIAVEAVKLSAPAIVKYLKMKQAKSVAKGD